MNLTKYVCSRWFRGKIVSGTSGVHVLRRDSALGLSEHELTAAQGMRPDGRGGPADGLGNEVVAPTNGRKEVVQQLVPAVLIMLADTWSDRYGRRRKPLIALPVAGQIAVAIAFPGGLPMFYSGVHSCVADTTVEEWRTIKYGISLAAACPQAAYWAHSYLHTVDHELRFRFRVLISRGGGTLI